MNNLHSIAIALNEQVKLNEELRKAEDYAGQLSGWRHFLERWIHRGKMASLQSEIAAKDLLLGSDAVQRIADSATDQLWRKAANFIIPNKNPYGSSAGVERDHILEHLWTNRYNEGFELGPNCVEFSLKHVPAVDAFVTKTFIQTNVDTSLAERARIAADTRIYKRRITIHGNDALVIQHRASGLRIMFILHGDGFGEVFAESHAIDSIDPDYSNDSDGWKDLFGLGIGRRLYRAGHLQLPDVRWRTKAFTPFSKPLRKKLHAADPYVWELQCDWCEEKFGAKGSWKAADKQFFEGHPKTMM